LLTEISFKFDEAVSTLADRFPLSFLLFEQEHKKRIVSKTQINFILSINILLDLTPSNIHKYKRQMQYKERKKTGKRSAERRFIQTGASGIAPNLSAPCHAKAALRFAGA
jgi:hypothetical protein